MFKLTYTFDNTTDTHLTTAVKYYREDGKTVNYSEMLSHYLEDN